MKKLVTLLLLSLFFLGLTITMVGAEDTGMAQPSDPNQSILHDIGTITPEPGQLIHDIGIESDRFPSLFQDI